MPKQNCFTYGSLMCEDIMSAVCDCEVHGEAATLHGFARHPVRDEHYPGITPQQHASVAGVLYRELAPPALKRLDAFEGEQYRRSRVRVQLAGGAAIDAETYVFRREYAHLLLPGEWDFERFLSNGKRAFVGRYLGFIRL